MTLNKLTKKFTSDESGVITTDTMLMIAAGGLLSVAVMVFASAGVEQLDKDKAYQLKAQEKVTTF
ncbi:hypothetical protein SAMN05444273_103463 [Litoreibacter ascidiaceicola]|uniref:Flp pilus assembly protein, pilin Flp n=1 Tax=Litoreibacter ascidiaceicola TaxID=1486859 RepID=A0A1M4Y941_9RHOB|nr:hypothetical protein [Litoreibacter ascidiaceicola]SHF02218.1 hypothetical protein SAMN05444273_103463 [Litoreibacter ascidiaceicola]